MKTFPNTHTHIYDDITSIFVCVLVSTFDIYQKKKTDTDRLSQTQDIHKQKQYINRPNTHHTTRQSAS